MADTKTVTQCEADSQEEAVQLTVRIPRDLHIRVKQAIAPIRGLTINKLVAEALETRLEKLDTEGK